MIIMSFNDDIETKVGDSFICCKCNYSTNKKYNYDKHLLTTKHKLMVNMIFNNKVDKVIEKINQENQSQQKENKYVCDCGKRYKYRQGLFVHRQNCDYEKPEDTKNLIIKLIQQNQTLQNSLIELTKENNKNNV